ncbi:transposase [Streptomyces sp. INA 01156]
MTEKRRKFDAEFREGAMRIVTATGKRVAQDLRVNETTPASWVSRARRVGRAVPEDKDALIARLLQENKQLTKDVKGVEMEGDVLERCMVLWVKRSWRRRTGSSRNGTARPPSRPSHRSGTPGWPRRRPRPGRSPME